MYRDIEPEPSRYSSGVEKHIPTGRICSNLSLRMRTEKSSGKKNVLPLSTMRPLNGITRDDNEQKSGIDKFYDFNDYYTVRSHSNRWDLVAFYYILDTIRGNAKKFFV